MEENGVQPQDFYHHNLTVGLYMTVSACCSAYPHAYDKCLTCMLYDLPPGTANNNLLYQYFGTAHRDRWLISHQLTIKLLPHYIRRYTIALPF